MAYSRADLMEVEEELFRRELAACREVDELEERLRLLECPLDGRRLGEKRDCASGRADGLREARVVVYALAERRRGP